MKALTREQAIENHRKLWNWIADETLRQKRKVRKEEYPLFKNGEHERLQNCYACEYRKQAGELCDKCIIDWGDSINDVPLGCCDMGSPYEEWLRLDEYEDEDDYERAAELARQIAELPERKV